MKFLNIIIPVYNEQRRLPTCLIKCFQFRQTTMLADVIFVENGHSIDQTAEFIQAYARRYDWVHAISIPAKGKGAAVRAGMLMSDARYCYMADCDFSTPISQIPRFIDALDSGADLVIGSRVLEQASTKITAKRRVIGRIFHRLVSGLAPGIKDTQCGFKLFKQSTALEIFNKTRIDGFAFDIEVLYLARQMGYSVKEIPVPWIADAESKVDLLRDSFAMLIDVISIPFIHAQQKELPA